MNSFKYPAAIVVIEPELVNEATAAAILDESHEQRKKNRREDQKRLERSEPIKGPAWIRDGERRIKYRPKHLRDYAASLPTILDKFRPLPLLPLDVDAVAGKTDDELGELRTECRVGPPLGVAQ
jgi:hypothetical protein